MADKSPFILVSLEEDKAKSLAQVLSNDSCRRILDALSVGEASETELAKSLEVPLSTVHYNISLLLKAGLVQVENFHYSDKGKEVNHYALANKYVIIAPKGETLSLRERLSKFLPIVPVLATGGALAWWAQRLRLGQLSREVAAALPPTMADSLPATPIAASVAEPVTASIAPPNAAPMLAQKVADSTPEVARIMAEQGGAGASGISDAARGAIASPDISAANATSISDATSQAADAARQLVEQVASGPAPQELVQQMPDLATPWWAHPAFWFLVGALLASLCLLLMYRWAWWRPTMRRKNQE